MPGAPGPPPLSARRSVPFKLSESEAWSHFTSADELRQQTDSAVLPKSTNMSLATVVLPPGVRMPPGRGAASGGASERATGSKCMCTREKPRISPQHTPPPAGGPCFFKRFQASGCRGVSAKKSRSAYRSIAEALEFYTHILTFKRYGPTDASRASIFRGEPGVRPGASGRPGHATPVSGVRINLRAAPGAQEPGSVPTTTIWIEVREVDALFDEVAARLYQAVQVYEGYFPEHYYWLARVTSKPKITPWDTREFGVVDPDGNTLVFFQAM